MTTVGIGYGASTTSTASSSVSPFITLTLDATYSDIAGVTLYPRTDTFNAIYNSYNVTVILSTVATYASDTSAVTCSTAARLIERQGVFIPCPAAAGKPLSFLTIVRTSNAGAVLELQEAMIYRTTGGWAHSSATAVAAPQRYHISTITTRRAYGSSMAVAWRPVQSILVPAQMMVGDPMAIARSHSIPHHGA